MKSLSGNATQCMKCNCIQYNKFEVEQELNSSLLCPSQFSNHLLIPLFRAQHKLYVKLNLQLAQLCFTSMARTPTELQELMPTCI